MGARPNNTAALCKHKEKRIDLCIGSHVTMFLIASSAGIFNAVKLGSIEKDNGNSGSSVV